LLKKEPKKSQIEQIRAFIEAVYLCAGCHLLMTGVLAYINPGKRAGDKSVNYVRSWSFFGSFLDQQKTNVNNDN